MARGYALNSSGLPYGDVVWRLTSDQAAALRTRGECTAADCLSTVNGWNPDDFQVVPAWVCACCGDRNLIHHMNGLLSPFRCDRHAGRNPCAIEGCTKTTAAPGDGTPADDQYLCAEHWRRFCPPRSLRRRTYHAFFRRAKRDGWSPELKAQFWRYWRALIRNARRKADLACATIEIVESSGPPPPALIAELQRLGL